MSKVLVGSDQPGGQLVGWPTPIAAACQSSTYGRNASFTVGRNIKMKSNKKLLPSFNLNSCDEYYKAVVRIFVKKEY